jgi:plastocyanin
MVWIPYGVLSGTALPLLFATLPLSAASIVGTVPLPEAPPATVMAKRYEIVSRGGVLSTIPPVGVVWLEGALDPEAEKPALEMVQKDFLVSPSLIVIPTGGSVSFPNLDDEYHNVFSYSPPKRFDLGRYMPGEEPVPSQVFDQPGLVTVRCEIHEHMRAIILVVDSSHYTTTGTDGRFRLDGLPAGTYTLKAWVNSELTLEKQVTLEAAQTIELSFGGE